MQSLVQYLLNRTTEECCEAGQAFSKLFTFGVNHRHPVTKEPAIMKAAQEINDILGVVDMLRDFGVDVFGIGKPEAIEAKKLKMFRNMQESIDAGTVVLTADELARLNAAYPDEKPLVPHKFDQTPFSQLLTRLKQLDPTLIGNDGSFTPEAIETLTAAIRQRHGTVPHEDGVISTVRTDGGIVTTL